MWIRSTFRFFYIFVAMKRNALSILLLTISLGAAAQGYQANEIQTFNMTKAGIKPRNYSGIVHLEGSRYALVSDKEDSDGFFIFSIEQDSITGRIISVKDEGLRSANTSTQRDSEGICARICNGDTLIYIAAENDQQILEYNSNGIPTGKSMNIPEEFSKNNIQGNYGFESLAYSAATNQFWTTTENALKKDTSKPNEGVRLRLQSFDDNLKPKHQYKYRTDAPIYGNKKKRNYAFGVAEICALADSSLIVLEREFIVTSNYIGSKCNHKLYIIRPTKNDVSMEKDLLYSFETKFNLSHKNLANYEGMCLGARLSNGKQTLLLVNDSQAGAGNKIFALQDYLKVISISYPREAE